MTHLGIEHSPYTFIKHQSITNLLPSYSLTKNEIHFCVKDLIEKAFTLKALTMKYRVNIMNFETISQVLTVFHPS